METSRTTAHSCDTPFLSKIEGYLDGIFARKKSVPAKCPVVRGLEKNSP